MFHKLWFFKSWAYLKKVLFFQFKQGNNGFEEDPAWDNWGFVGILFGLILTVLGILLQVLEIVRIYNGVYNFGLKNFDLSDQLQFPIGNISNSQFLFGERWHYWPWTYPGKLAHVFKRIFIYVILVQIKCFKVT